MSRRWRYPRTRRGIFYQIFTTQAAPAAPSYAPVFQEPSGRSSRSRTTRRGQFFRVIPATVVQVLPCIPAVMEPADRSSRLAAGRARRGQFFKVPLVGVAPPAAPWIPPPLDTRRAPALPVRRGEFLVVPLVGAAPPPPVVVPQVVRSHVRVIFGRRGHFWPPPLVQQAATVPWVPPVTRARRNPAGPVRRGEYLSVPLPRATCPARIVSRRTVLPVCRRGRTWVPPWIFVPPAGPGPYIPKIITSPHRPPVRPTRRGVFIEPAWPSMAHSCTTPRPNSGTTARPNGTTTARPNAGITGRPCAAT